MSMFFPFGRAIQVIVRKLSALRVKQTLSLLWHRYQYHLGFNLQISGRDHALDVRSTANAFSASGDPSSYKCSNEAISTRKKLHTKCKEKHICWSVMVLHVTKRDPWLHWDQFLHVCVSSILHSAKWDTASENTNSVWIPVLPSPGSQVLSLP